MTRPLYMFRPNLQNEDHRKAWEILQSVPEGQKSAFLVRAILAAEQQRELEATLCRVLREELKAVPSQPVQQPEERFHRRCWGSSVLCWERNKPDIVGIALFAV